MTKKYIFIHKKFYDLSSIKNNHPGGNLKIFECLENEKDCTALFESSHCMKDIHKIYEMMKSFEIPEQNYKEYGITNEVLEEKKLLPVFNFDNYHELAKEVKEEFKYNKNYKVNNFWYVKLSVLISLYLICFLKGLIFNKRENFLLNENCIFAFLSGIIWVNIGFCIMHDGSHYALFKTNYKNKKNYFLNALSYFFNFYFYKKDNKNIPLKQKNEDVPSNDQVCDNNQKIVKYEDTNNGFKKLTEKEKIKNTEKKNNDNKYLIFGLIKKTKRDSNINDILNSIWQGWSLWNSYIWFKHHTYAHHSFTGIFGLDPDLIHLRPMARKTNSDNKTIRFLISVQEKTIWIILFFLPGMFSGQIVSYLVGALRGHIWKVSISKVFTKTPIVEFVLYLISLCVLIFNKNLICVYFYLIGLNMMYALCIIPDHDTFESANENDKETNDWCEMQIRKSGNFCEDNLFFTELNGGINYQIHHHLFPTIAHCHYEKISRRIKEFCLRKNIPYVHHKSLIAVYYSYMKTIRFAAIVNKKE